LIIRDNSANASQLGQTALDAALASTMFGSTAIPRTPDTDIADHHDGCGNKVYGVRNTLTFYGRLWPQIL
jgi:hypothetical protein